MEYNFWKTVLLDWVNSTGFLVQNYENLGDTNVDTFFEAFKKQIKSTTIKSKNVISFVEEYYKDFYLKLDNKHAVPVSEYVYLYSLFLHFACVLHADMSIQHICNNMVRKNQESIEKFLDYLFKMGRCERGIVQTAIEEAENCEYGLADQSPITRNIQSLMSNMSPQTPKSRMLNSWNVENRNLKAQLETERFERGYLEMQLSQCEKKLAKMDDDYKEALIQNNYLKKQIQSLDEHDQLSQIAQNDVTVRQLRREVEEKEHELLNLTIAYNESKSDVETLTEKLQYAETQVKTLNTKLLESFSEAEAFKNQLDEREKMINYMNNNIKELSDLLKELQSNSKKVDLDSSSSCEILSSTTNDFNSSNFLEENLASAVIDIRLLDQQKQNMALNESLNRVQSELSTVQEEMIKLYKNMVVSGDDVELPSPDAILSQLNEKYTEITAQNQTLLDDVKRQSVEIESMRQQIDDLNSESAKKNEALQESLSKFTEQSKELYSVKGEMSSIQEEIVRLYKNVAPSNETVELPSPNTILSQLNEKFIEMTDINNNQTNEVASLQQQMVELNTKLDEYSKNNETLQASLDTLTSENKELTECQSELNQKLSEKQEQHQILSSKIEGHLLEIASLHQQINDLSNESVKKNEALQESLSKFTEQSKELDSVKGELFSIQDEIIRLYKNVAPANDSNELPTSNTMLLQLNEKFVEMADINNNKTNEVESLQQQIVESNAKLDQRFKEIQILQESLDRLKEINEALSSVIAKMTEANQTQSAEIENKSKEITSQQQQIAELNANIDEHTKNVAILKESVEKLKEENKAMSGIQCELTAIQAKAIELYENVVKPGDGAELPSPDTLFSSLHEKYAELSDTNQSQSVEIEKQSSEIASKQQQIDDLNNESAKNSEALQESLDKFAEQTKELDSVKGELSSIQEEIIRLYKSVASSNESIELPTPNAILSHLNEKIVKLTHINQNQTSEAATMQQQMVDLNTKLDEYSKNNETLQESLNKLTTENKALTECQNELKEKFADKQEQHQILSNQIEAHLLEMASLQQQIAESNTKLDERSKEIQILQESLNKLKEENQVLSGVNAEMAEAKQTHLAEIETKSKEITSQLQQIAELNANIDEHTKNVAILKESVEKLKEENKAMSGIQCELAAIQAQAIELYKNVVKPSDETELPSSDAVFSPLNEKYAEITDINQNLSGEIEKQSLEIASKQQQIDDLSNESAKNSEALQESLGKFAEQSKELDSVKGELSSIQEEIIRLYKNVAQENESVELQNPNTILSQLNQKIVEMSDINQNQTSEAATMQQQIDALKTKLDERSKEIQILQESLNKLKEENQALSGVNAEMDEAKHTHLAEIENKSKEITSQQQQIAELNRKLEDYSKNNETLQESLNKLTMENKALHDCQNELKEKFSENQEKHQILSNQIEAHLSEIASMQQQIAELNKKLDERSQENEMKEAALKRAKEENQLLIESSTNKEQLNALNEQLIAMEKINNERIELWRKEKENLIQDVKICRAKLMKEREAAEHKDKEFKEMRNSYEEKLEKMKEKMKNLYKAEMAKVQEKHMEQLNEVHNENRRQTAEKLGFYEEKLKEFSMQVHSLNEEKLLLLKEHEIMKAKLRTFEIDSTLNRGNGTNGSSAMFFDKIRGKNFRMEDEEGELFDNTYLDELKRGSGRESLTLDEIQRRNSMVPPHLRSSYMPQFYNDEPKSNENFKSLNDSLFSNASEMRRGTAYKRPGPPTPSKNGGRFSLGGGSVDLPRGDILREQNGATERPSIGGSSKAAKKHTPGKLSRLFSTAKLKDEEEENSRNNLEHLRKIFFSTSTPRRRPTRHSSLPKFETTELLGLMNNSLSTIDNKCMADTKRFGGLARNMMLQSRRLSRKIFASAGKNPTNTDSTPEYEPVHGDCTKLVTPRKSFVKKRTAVLKKKAMQYRTQREKRFAAYDQRRRMSEMEATAENETGKTFSIASRANLSTATYDVMLDDNDNIHNLSYESEIHGFQEEINECEGPMEIVVDNLNDEIDFEKLCNVKQSECPFVENKVEFGQTMTLPKLSNGGKLTSNLNAERDGLNFSPRLASLSVSGTRMSSHIGRLCWNQQKIPIIEKFKAEKKSFDNESQHSSGSNHSTQPLCTTIKSFQSNVTVGWQATPKWVQYYVIALTIGFLSIVYHQFLR